MPLPRWSPDVTSLDLLLSVAELGSVGKAAAAHGISQPAASARLDRLERQVRLVLLTRTPTGSALTPAGAVFAAWAREVVAAVQTLDDNVAALQHTRSARLRIAASLTVAEYLLPAWLVLLRRGHPDLDVTAVVANSHDVCDGVRAGSADVGFVEMPTVPADFHTARVGLDRLVLVAAPSYPAAARTRGATAPSDLLDQPLLLRERGSGTRETFLQALAQALGRDDDPPLRHAVELGSTATILATARAGGGIGVISARAARADLDTGSLAEVRVPGLVAERPLTALWLGRTASPAAKVLVDLARQADATS